MGWLHGAGALVAGQPPADMPDMERLAWYQAARAAEEERAVVEDLVRRREAGERLAPHEEAKIAYSPFGTAGGCPVTTFFLGSR